MWAACRLWVALALGLLLAGGHALRESKRKLRVTFLGRFYQGLKAHNIFTPASVEKTSCKEAKSRESVMLLHWGHQQCSHKNH